jgi:hypothetical protein
MTSDLGPLIVVAPTTHDGIDLLYQLSSGHRCATACEPTNLLLEVVDTHSNARFGREVEWNVRGNDCFLCELYPQHRTAVSVSPVTVGALDHVRYPEQSGEHMITESSTARDPIRTLVAVSVL